MASSLHSKQAGEDTTMKTKLLALILMAGGSMFAQSRFSVGVSIGSGPGPVYYRPAPVAMRAYRPGFVWVEGHMIRTRFGREWIPGHWERRSRFNSDYYYRYR